MRIAVIGAGAMGCLFGGKLARQNEVWLVDGWEEHVQAIQQQGLFFIHPDGREEIIRVQATSDPAAVPLSDLAIIFVKSYQTRWAAQQAVRVLAADALALTLQNGLGNAEIIAEVIGSERTVQGVTAHGATLLGPGRVRHAGTGPTHLAQPAHVVRPVQPIVDAFNAAGLDTTLSDNVEALVWGKLVINVGINALTALLRVPNGQLNRSPTAAGLMRQAVEEAAAVARARGIQLPYPDPPARVAEVAAATGTNRSSMLADVLRGAPTEIEVINGAIVHEGRRLGVPTPVNEVLYRLVLALHETAPARVGQGTASR